MNQWVEAVWALVGASIFLQAANSYWSHSENRSQRDDSLKSILQYLGKHVLESQDYRLTLFSPTRRRGAVGAYLRYHHGGEGLERLAGLPQFLREVGVAGAAFAASSKQAQRAGWIVTDQIPSYADDPDEWFRFHTEALKVPPATVKGYSTFMQRVRHLHALSIIDERRGRCVAVLCLDSCLEEPTPEVLLKEISNTARIMAYALGD